MSALLEYQFTTAEAAALSELPEKRVRKEFEYKVLEAKGDPRVSFSGLVYLRTMQRTRLKLAVEARTLLYGRIREALAAALETSSIQLDELITVALAPVRAEMQSRGERFLQWREQLVTDPDIMAGETVFPNSRLTVRHVGEILERGESEEAVREDYPYLRPEDLEFARLYVRAYPRVGRPPAAR